MRQRQKVSRAGVELIKSFEGLRSTAARLPDGRWTLGYGHTFSAREGARVTQEDADALLRFDLLPVVDSINNLVLVPLNQNQFDALVSFCFNIGVDNFAQSSVLKCINEGRATEAALAMDSWRSAEFNGQTYVLAPLIRRRAAEKNLFLTPEDNVGHASSLLVRPTLDAAPVASVVPSELSAPDLGGVLSAYPMSAPGFSPYAQPVTQPAPQPVQVQAPAPAPAPERQVIDLNSYTARPMEVIPPPYATPREQVVEQLPDGIVSSSAIRPVAAVPVVEPALPDEPQMSPAVQAALARAQEEARLEQEQRQREEAFRQAEAAAAAARAAEDARLQQERMETARREQERLLAEQQERERAEAQARIEQEAFERARLEREAQENAERVRIEREQAEREQAAADARAEEERLAREAAAVQVVAAPTDAAADEAEKQRKAEAAAALMRLYSPYGAVGLGRPLVAPVAQPQPASVTVPEPVFEPTPAPVVQQAFTTQSYLTPHAAESAPEPEVKPAPVATEAEIEAPVVESSVVDFIPVASPRTMPPPTIVALNPYATAIPTAAPTQEPAPQVVAEPEPAAPAEPEVVEVPRPAPVDLAAAPAVDIFAPKPPVAEPVHWRDQLQRPLPTGFQTPEGEQASLLTPPPSQYGALYSDDNEEWTMDGGRIAVASDEHEHEERNVWQMIMDTLWWIVISGLGLGCLGVAAAAYTKSHDPSVIRNGFFNDYTSLSLIMAVAGILFVSISVWLIMKRLSGIKD